MKDLITFKFNQIGIVHNLTLDAIANLKDFPNVSNEAAYYMGINVQNSLFDFHCNEVQYPGFDEISPYYDLIAQNSFNRVIEELLKNGKLSDLLATIVKKYFNKLETVENYDELEKAVSDFIKDFTSNDKLTEIDNIICWGIASVTLFSYNYWNDTLFNPKNLWYNIISNCNDNGNASSQRRGFWRIVGVIVADCAGILVGGALGSIFGPAGAAAGAGAAGSGASAAAGRG